MYETLPNNNYGACGNLWTGGANGDRERSLIQFNLSSIPAGSAITSATLRLHAEDEAADTTSNRDISVHRVWNSWTEGTGSCSGASGGLTWNNRSTGKPFSTAGGSFSSAADTTTVGSLLRFYEWDVTSMAQGWVDGTFPNNGLLLKFVSDVASYKAFASSEDGTSSQRPTLIVTYQVPPIVGGASSVVVGNTANVTPSTGGTWTSSNPAIATVTNGGLVTGVSPGLVVLTFTDTATGLTANRAITVFEAGANTDVTKEYFVALPDNDLSAFFDALETDTGTTNDTTVSITVGVTGTRIVYDHWEDGLESDIDSPIQPTTQIWGDGNNSNGVPPGFANDPVGFALGDVIALRNNVPTPRNPSVILFDGRDRIGTTRSVVVTRAGWDTTEGPILAGAVECPEVSTWGTRFISTFGQNSGSQFQFTALHVIAKDDNTVVQIDADANGSFELSATLGRGESYNVPSGVLQGAEVISDKPLMVQLTTGLPNIQALARFYTLTPEQSWPSTVYVPTPQITDNGDIFGALVRIYNPNATAITITAQTPSGSTNVPISANSFGSYQMPAGSGARIFSTGGQPFLPLVAFSDNPVDETADAYDWGYTPISESDLTTLVILGWAPGNSGAIDPSRNGSPAFVTPTANTRLYIDYDGDQSGSLIDPSGFRYDAHLDVTALSSSLIFDPDGDQTAMRIYTLDGTLLAAAWGEDPVAAGPFNPFLDLGTTVLPFNTLELDKTSALFNDLGATGLSIGDIIEYTIPVTNVGNGAISDLLVEDVLPAQLSYIAGTTRLDGVAIADSGSTPFPLDEAGYTIAFIPPLTTVNITFRAEIIQSGTVTNVVTLPKEGITAEDVIEVPDPVFGSVSGTILHDTNCDGVGDLPVVGQRVALWNIENFTYITETTTDGTGAYSFTGIAPESTISSGSAPGIYDVYLSPVSSGFIIVSDTDGGDIRSNGDQVPLDFTSGGDITGQDWVFRFTDGFVAASDTDGDVFPPGQEYTFGGDPKSGNHLVEGTTRRAGMTISENTTGGIDISYVRFARRSDAVVIPYVSHDPRVPTNWTAVTAVPVVTDNGDGTETVTWANIHDIDGNALVTADRGFVRLYVDPCFLDPSWTLVQGWHRSVVDGKRQTHGRNFSSMPVFTGFIDSTSGSQINTPTSGKGADLSGLLLDPAALYYLELTSGPAEGERFDLASGGVDSFTLNLGSGNNTLGALPSGLAGSYFVIRRHETLGEIYPNAEWDAAGSVGNADQVLLYGGTGYTTYFNLNLTGAWARQGASFASQNGLIIAPGTGMLVVHAAPNDVNEILQFGDLRYNDFRRPLALGTTGLNFTSLGFPFDNTPAGLDMTIPNGFVGSTAAGSSSQILNLAGDTVVNTTGWTTSFLLSLGGDWRSQQNVAVITSNSPLFRIARAAQVDVQQDKLDWKHILPWDVTPWSQPPAAAAPSPSTFQAPIEAGPFLDPESREPLISYESWSLVAFPSNRLANEDTAAADSSLDLTSAEHDFDGDGDSNFLEFAAGTDPTIPNAPYHLTISTGSSSKGDLQIELRRAPGRAVVWRLEASDDMVKFSPVVEGARVAVSEGDRVVYSVEKPSSGSRFYRVQALPMSK